MFIQLFIACMLGHFVGDYLFQNQLMADTKSKKGWEGFWMCTLHVLFYMVAITIFAELTVNNWVLLLLIAIPHWLIDRYGIGWHLLYIKNGYDSKKIWQNPELERGLAKASTIRETLAVHESASWKTAFTAPVYIMNDNTLHWVCIWFAIKFILRAN